MSNFNINVDRRRDEQTDRTEKRNGKVDTMSQSQEVGEMFHAKFDGC